MKSKLNFSILVILVITLLLVGFSHGAKALGSTVGKIFFDILDTELAPGSIFMVTVRLSSVVPVNAFDIEIGYSPSVFLIEKIETELSVMNIWKNAVSSDDSGIIKLTGGSIKAFQGESGELLRLYVKAKSAGQGSFSFRKADIYQSDGLGTPVIVERTIGKVVVTHSAKLKTSVVEKNDQPNSSSYNVERIKDVVTGSEMLLVKESGLRIGEFGGINISERKWFIWGDWKKSTHPVMIGDGVWSVQIRLVGNNGVAFDKTIIFWDVLLSKVGLSLFFGIILIFLYLKYLKRVVL